MQSNLLERYAEAHSNTYSYYTEINIWDQVVE